MKAGLALFAVAGRLFAAPTAQIHGFTRAEASARPGEDRLALIDLHRWLGAPPQRERKLILVNVEQELVGLLVDAVVDLEMEWSSVLALPPLVGFVGCDPAVVGVTLIDELPALVLDLELLARRLERQEPTVGDGG